MPVLKEFRPKIIALCLGESGPPNTAEERVAHATQLVDLLTAEGYALDDIYVDGCVLPVSTGPEHGKGLLEAVGLITARYPGVHASAGISNVSFGLPLRKLLNETFAVLLMAHGLDAGIVDPCDAQLMANIRAAEALLGRDEYCAGLPARIPRRKAGNADRRLGSWTLSTMMSSGKAPCVGILAGAEPCPDADTERPTRAIRVDRIADSRSV